MKVEILFHTHALPNVHEDVYAIYTKDALLCVHLMTGLIVKYPLINIFSVAHMHGDHMGTTFVPNSSPPNWPIAVPYVPKMKDNSPPRFDLDVLKTLQNPLSVRVERIKGSYGTPIELPTKEGFTPGFGWSKDEVAKLEGWLVTDYTGGGLYHFVVVDSAGKKMEWYTAYDIKFYPERMPTSSKTIPERCSWSANGERCCFEAGHGHPHAFWVNNAMMAGARATAPKKPGK